jgi:hypothetical protein
MVYELGHTILIHTTKEDTMNIQKLLFSIGLSITLSACLFDSDNDTNTPEKEDSFQEQSSQAQSSSAEQPSSVQTTNARVYMHTSDFQSGKLHWMAVSDTAFHPDSSLVFDDDSKLKIHQGQVYLLERASSNLVKINPWAPLKDRVEYQVNLGAKGKNPHDIAFYSDTQGFIAAFGTEYILEVNPQTGALGKSIDLSAYSFADSTYPNIEALEVVNNTIVAILQRLNGYTPTLPGLAVLIDAKTLTVQDTITLPFSNPASSFVADGKLYIACTEGWSATDFADSARGIAVVDIEQKTAQVLAYGHDLGGMPLQIQPGEDNTIITAIYKGWQNVGVGIYDIQTKTMQEVPGISNAFGGIFASPFGLWIGEQGDGTSQTGVYQWQQNDLSSLYGTGLMPPYSIAVVSEKLQ